MSELWIPPLDEQHINVDNPLDMLVEFQKIISEIEDFDEQVKKARELFAMLQADAVKTDAEIEATIASSTLLLAPELSRPDVALQYNEAAVIGNIEKIGFMNQMLGQTALNIVLNVEAMYLFPIAEPDNIELIARKAHVPISHVHYIEFADAA